MNSNLGLYQTFTTAAKQVGGVNNLITLIVQRSLDIGVEEGFKMGVAAQRPVIAGVGLAGLVIGGLIVHLWKAQPPTLSLKADKILAQDEELNGLTSEFKRIINDESDIERVRTILEENDIDEVDADVTLESLKKRLDALKSDIADYRNYLEEEEEDLNEFRFEDELFSFLAEVDMDDEDDVFVRIAQTHPAYKPFARVYRENEPEADELQVVKAFAISMAPYTEEEDHDEI